MRSMVSPRDKLWHWLSDFDCVYRQTYLKPWTIYGEPQEGMPLIIGWNPATMITTEYQADPVAYKGSLMDGWSFEHWYRRVRIEMDKEPLSRSHGRILGLIDWMGGAATWTNAFSCPTEDADDVWDVIRGEPDDRFTGHLGVLLDAIMPEQIILLGKRTQRRFPNLPKVFNVTPFPHPGDPKVSDEDWAEACKRARSKW